MKFLRKTKASLILQKGWRYAAHARQIRLELMREQGGFCAYTEKYLEEIDSVDVEHFDHRLKNDEADSYWNWYAVLHFINQKKRNDIEKHEPILTPYDESTLQRIVYRHGQFQPTNQGDREANNLINFLRLNDAQLAAHRNQWIARQKATLQRFFQGNKKDFIEFLKSVPGGLSYATALEAELDITIDLP